MLPHDVAARIAAWRAAGKRIVFTNGVFDILHPGHLAQLEAARSFGDALVVGLNSDASVRGLHKGPERPIFDESARRRMLEALRCVDAVVLFDAPTPLELIREIRPDVLVKGSDYTSAEVVGRDFVEAQGGRVELVPLVPGYSTTAVVERIRAGK
jgi:rfaE bifunctional protein nucleotidyltransferase chain/domain